MPRKPSNYEEVARQRSEQNSRAGKKGHLAMTTLYGPATRRAWAKRGGRPRIKTLSELRAEAQQ